ncbi:MAG: response regulator [Desulfobacterales bacterium]|nr:response regulator [Desulfobacterales bacterium]MDD4071627.1 response regulator [Desulfobacterales bacterium]MDD4391627.1 response regulator [Desulfobacterales bacterium]
MNRIKILIAEDSITQAMQLQHILEVNGYEVAMAANGSEALQSIDSSRPSIVISDIIMPEMNGFELCHNIKADERLRSISVILLTSLSDPQDVIRAVQCGADQFVTKPYDGKYLLSTIDNLLHNENLHDREEDSEGIHLSYRDKKYVITSNRRQILNLLLSSYETAIAKNSDLMKAQDELKKLNTELEERVRKRTETLHIEVAERKTAQAALLAKNEEFNTVTQQLWQAAKLATMGELASSIAHELNNPLATVSLRIESLTAQTSPDDKRRRALEIIGQEVERMGNLVTNLLQFSRRSQKQISTLDICEEIEKSIELILYHLKKYDIRVIKEFEPDIPWLLADRQQLRQLFLNLFTNASDAMPKGGTLTIRVTAHPERKKILIEIADTGIGIPPEILPKVMESFYTTKPEGKGTGLGLAICRRIAEEHRGSLDIASDGIPGKGTKILITLSAMDQGNEIGLMDP